VIETERLLLRLPRPEDAEQLLEFVSDDEVMRPIGGEAGDIEQAQESVERWIRRWERDGVGQFAVDLDGVLIGRVGLLVWDTRTWTTASYADAGEQAETEIGWALTRRFWGHGYATEAARAAREWAYAERGLDRLISMIAPENLRSQRVAEKLGARVEKRIELAEHGPADVWLHPR
jgi:RimJ/RimL family protein N-acetyltransferase